MTIRSWRRLHGTHLIAQVDPVPGFWTWSTRAWIETEPDRSESPPRQFESLTSAQATADAWSASATTSLRSGDVRRLVAVWRTRIWMTTGDSPRGIIKLVTRTEKIIVQSVIDWKPDTPDPH
jgi:hypothetical protein